MTGGETAHHPLAVRFRFWRDGFWRVALANVFTAAAALLPLGDHVYTALHPPEPLYFYTDTQARLVRDTPLDQPVVLDADLVDFTAHAVLAVYNFDHEHYRETLSREAAPDFTVHGWNGVVSEVQATHNLDEIKAQSMVVSARPLASPVIRQGPALIGDHLAWSIRMPIQVTYANQKENRKAALLVTATVIRAPATLFPKGMAIDSFVAAPLPSS